MEGILTTGLQTPLVTRFVEEVLSKVCECSSDFSQHALMGECAELNICGVHSGNKLLCSDCRTSIYHQSDVVAVGCGSLEVALQGAGVWKFHCKEPVKWGSTYGVTLSYIWKQALG